MTVRKILSARTARPHVEALLKGLVQAAVYMGRSDGVFREVEVDSLIDAVRDVVTRAVGEDFLGDLASTPRLLDWARQARALLRTESEDAFLADVAQAFQGGHKRDALIVAYRICAADGAITPAETTAFRKLARAMGLDGLELDALETMASRSAQASHPGRDDVGIAKVKALMTRGWRDPFADLRTAGLEPGQYDAAVAWVNTSGATVRLDLDAESHLLHVHLGEPHLVIPYGTKLDEVLALLDDVKETLTVATLDVYLPKLSVLCGDLFLERNGHLVRV
jgi:tellurite resistance protein